MHIISDSIIINEVDSEYIADVKVVINKPGTTNYSINIYATLIKEIPAATGGLVSILKKTGDKYIAAGIKLQKNVCELIKTEKMFYPSIVAQGTFPAKCPILSRKYQVENYKVPVDNFPPMMPTGDWKLIFELKLKDKILVDGFWLGHVKY